MITPKNADITYFCAIAMREFGGWFTARIMSDQLNMSYKAALNQILRMKRYPEIDVVSRSIGGEMHYRVTSVNNHTITLSMALNAINEPRNLKGDTL